MNKAKKIVNKFNRSHQSLRKFLRLVSYGCYHRQLYGLHKITPRSYDDFLRQLRFFIPTKNIQVTWHNKCAYFTFVGDLQRGTKNYLYSSFLLKTFLPEHCLQSVIILQITEKSKNPMSLSEIIDSASNALTEYNSDFLEVDLFQVLRRRLNELADSGILCRLKIKNKFFYEKVSNPLGKLSADELENLISAVNFYKNYSMIETAGYFFHDTLKELYRLPTADKGIFQFKNNNYVRILDDDILLKINHAMTEGKKIFVERENKSSLLLDPLSIETDFLCSRQYLASLKGKEPVKIRLDKIIGVKITSEESKKFLPAPEKLRQIKLKVTFKDFDEKNLREKILAEEFDFKIITESKNFFICVIETADPLKYYPRLWKFQTWAEILPGADGLRERIKKDAEDALKNYEEFI